MLKLSRKVDDCKALGALTTKGLHSSTFRLDVSTFLWDTLSGFTVSVTETAQVELIKWTIVRPWVADMSPKARKGGAG